MSQLPFEFEIILLIFEHAAEDRHTAAQLCLINKAILHFIQPILYQHVCLRNTKQVECFNYTVDSSSQIRSLIKGVTLLDQIITSLPEHLIDVTLIKEAEDSDWPRHYRKLIDNIGTLSKYHNLTTLVLSAEAAQRLSWSHTTVTNSVSWQFEDCGVKLDHLVMSHTGLTFYLCMLETKNLTVYGCEISTKQGRVGIANLNVAALGLLCSDHLENIKYILSDNHDHIEGSDSAQEGANHRDQKWVDSFVAQVDHLCKKQESTPEVSVYFHVNTQEAKEQMERRFQEVEFIVKVGVWGNLSDTGMTQAELESFADKGWIQRKPYILLKEADEIPNSTVIGWLVRFPPGNQWCGCVDQKGMSYTHGQIGNEGEFDAALIDWT
jgi:hypothetical protein